MDALLVRIAERITSGARSASVTFRGAGACPSSRVRDVGHPVRGGAGPRRPPSPPPRLPAGSSTPSPGVAPENCAFCAQSAHHQTDSPVYPLYDTDTLLRRAEELAANNVDRFGIVTSGTAPSDRDFDALCESALRIGREVKIGLCASLGLLTPERAAGCARRVLRPIITISKPPRAISLRSVPPTLRAGSGNRARGPLRRVPGVQLRHLRPWRDVGAAY